MSLPTFTVHEPCEIGWDINTPPNESVDEHGSPLKDAFGAADPRAPRQRAMQDPEVQAMRELLQDRNGINGLEICTPDEPERAARIFRRDGFVVVRDLLNPGQLEELREGCVRALEGILGHPGHGGRKYLTESYRLPHRYSFGGSSCSRQLMHDPAWTQLIELDSTTPTLEAIFGSDDYLVWGGGGDVCLPGAIEYQNLHRDVRDFLNLPEGRLEQARKLGIDLRIDESTGALELGTQRVVLERTPPLVTINFLVSDLTWENGPIRQIPGTHAMQQNPPDLASEPEWMRLSTLVGAPAGAGVFRDNRAWHGATPNVSQEIRAMPNIEYVAPWFPQERLARTMPHERWVELSPRAQRLCRYINAEEGEWPAGAGQFHPTLARRSEIFQAAGGQSWGSLATQP